VAKKKTNVTVCEEMIEFSASAGEGKNAG